MTTMESESPVKVKTSVHEKLMKLKKERGFHSLSEVIEWLIEKIPPEKVRLNHNDK